VPIGKLAPWNYWRRTPNFDMATSMPATASQVSWRHGAWSIANVSDSTALWKLDRISVGAMEEDAQYSLTLLCLPVLR
jgi:hypothetical protein